MVGTQIQDEIAHDYNMFTTTLSGDRRSGRLARSIAYFQNRYVA